MPSWTSGHVDDAVVELLSSGLAGTDLQSLLLEAVRRRARARAPAEVLAQYERDPFVRPAATDLRAALAVELHLLTAAERFEALELSPVAPLAACSSVAPTDQHRVLSALRSTEVVSDPTNVFALECASRLRATRFAAPVHLATVHRTLRAQPVPKLPGHAPHFALYALGSGGVEAPAHGFTVETLALHLRTLLAGLDRLEAHGYSFGARRVDLWSTPARAPLLDGVEGALGGVVPVARKPLEHPYYSGGMRFTLWVTAPDGAEFPLGDGGTFDWLTKLTSNRRAVYVASGFGAQLVTIVFARPKAP